MASTDRPDTAGRLTRDATLPQTADVVVHKHKATEGAQQAGDSLPSRNIEQSRGGSKHRNDSKAKTGGLSLLRETAIILVCALVVSWLIKSFLVQAFYIPSESMQDTLEVGDRIMVSRLVPGPFDLNRGDIIVFRDPGFWLPPVIQPDRGPIGNAVNTLFTAVGLIPEDSGEHLIKRTIGLPGDHVVCCDADGLIQINGVSIVETYLAAGAIPSQEPFDVTVPPGMLFVLGDNRQDSADSRFNTNKPYGGFVPVDNVVGTAFTIVWPPSRLTIFRLPSDVFAQVPDPVTSQGQ